MLNFYPSFIDNTDFNCVCIDGKYISTLCIVNFPKQMRFLEFTDSLPKDIQFDMSMYINKQDTVNVLKQLTYNISNSKSEVKTINNNQIDVDILNKLVTDAKKMRYEIQINNEQIYNTYTYLSIRSNSKENLLFNIKRVKNILYSKMLISNILNFRHLQGYLSTLPLGISNEALFKAYYVNMTTSNVVNNFPFYTDTVFDKNGVIFGYTAFNNRLCNIDIFNKKYTNSNICIFGSSGSGKSYFVKLLILRQYITNLKQFIFDPEGEYMNISHRIGGEQICFDNNSQKYINILDIDEVDIQNKDFLYKKIEEVFDFINKIIDIDLNYKEYVVQAIRKAYLEKGITEDIKSMYKETNNNRIYLNKCIKGSTDMPILSDIYDNLAIHKTNSNKILNELINNFKNMVSIYSYLDRKTNINLENKLIVFSLNKIKPKISNLIFEFILNKVIKKIKYSEEESVIYIDEVWKFIHDNPTLADQIFTLFKTIRKFNAGIVTITQDISDFFAKDMGTYGKTVINNSFVKIFFKMEYSDTDILERIGVLNTCELGELVKLDKGSMLMSFQSNIINLNIKSNNYEDKLIRGNDIDSSSS